MMRIVGRAIQGFAAGLLLLVFVLLIHVQVVSYSVSYYQSEFAKLSRPEALGTSIDELARFSRHTTRYLSGREEDPNVSLVLQGQERPLLNEREIAHMEDVQKLFGLARGLTIAGTSFFALSLLLSWKWGKLCKFLRSLAWTSAFALIIGLVFGLLISRDFTAAFDQFHWLAFTNDLWQLDPAKDQLINLLPEQFFADAVMLAATRTAVSLLLISATASFASIRPNRPKLS